MTDAVERMDPRCDAGGHGYRLWMEYRDDGGYVRATDYDVLAAKLAAAERVARYETDIAQQALDQMRAAEAALPAVYRLGLGDAADVAEYAGAVRMQSDGSYSHHEAVMGPTVACDVLALPTPTAAELMARINQGEKE